MLPVRWVTRVTLWQLSANLLAQFITSQDNSYVWHILMLCHCRVTHCLCLHASLLRCWRFAFCLLYAYAYLYGNVFLYSDIVNLYLYRYLCVHLCHLIPARFASVAAPTTPRTPGSITLTSKPRLLTGCTKIPACTQPTDDKYVYDETCFVCLYIPEFSVTPLLC